MEDVLKDVEKLKIIYKAKNYKELAEALNISKSAIDGWIRKKKLPSKYKIIIDFNSGQNNTYNNGNNNISSNGNNGVNIHGDVHINNVEQKDKELCELIKQLDPKQKEYFYHIIKAEVLKKNL